MRWIIFWVSVLNGVASVCFAETSDKLSYNDFVARCAQASPEKPYVNVSKTIQGLKTQTAYTVSRCWKEKDNYSALSELWVDGKKVYFTPRNALAQEVHCGTAGGEIYRPHSFSPGGNYFAFLLIPFCWETEPLTPVIMLYRYADKKTEAPSFTPIAKEIFKRYPKAEANKKNIDFVSTIVSWRGKEELLIDVDVICYGCIEEGGALSFPRTRWAMTPEENFSFVREVP